MHINKDYHNLLISAKPLTFKLKNLPAHTTSFELERLLNRKSNFNSKNLIIFTSTFLLVKLAKEIESFYYSRPNERPDNVILIGDEAFFKLIDRPSETNAIFKLKKMKSLFFEMFHHALDRNSRN